MGMKKCCMCGEFKELTHENFAWKKKDSGTFQSQCRPCHKEYRAQHYDINKEKYVAKARVWSDNEAKNFFTWLSDKSCIDCGISDIRVLEFDHVRGVKAGNISKMLGAVSRERLLEELEKCDIVCANCHRIRTAKQFDWYKYMRL